MKAGRRARSPQRLMFRFIYAVWFLDRTASPEDQHREWVACIEIRAPSESDAIAWGDHLSRGMCRRNPDNEFLSSEVRRPDDPLYAGSSQHELPVVPFGAEASDESLGW